jgi:HTH-type transcriptional regulator / antitoxin HipB
MDELLPLKPKATNGKIREASDLGGLLRARRRELGLTQTELAEACGCSPRFIGELERGVAGGNIKQVLKVCRSVGIDLYARVRGH